MKNIILGSDFYSDCDDAVAIRVLTTAHKQGKINLLGISLDACMELSVQALGGFLQSENCLVPIGIDKSATIDRPAKYQARLAKLPSPYKSNDDAEDAVTLYRRLLANANGKVDIAEIGFMQVLSALMNSEADEFSPLCGMELIKQKVNKLWLMAGKWDKPFGKEYNVAGNTFARRGANHVCKHWPTPITFLGWEVGANVYTGGDLPENDVLGDVIADYGCPNPLGRSSWDPMLALLAVIGDEQNAGYKSVVGKAYVSRLTGRNLFIKKPGGPHSFVVKLKPDSYYQQQINDIINGKYVF